MPQYRKKFLSICVYLLFTSGIYAQQNFTIPQELPSFKAELTNGTVLDKATLHFDKPLVFIYFSPDCEHCQALTRDLIKNIAAFKGTNILMISFMPLETVKKFQTDFKLGDYPNIRLGTEVPIFLFRNYYRLQQTPFIALFNKKAKIVKSYTKTPPIEDLVKDVKKLSGKQPSGHK